MISARSFGVIDVFRRSVFFVVVLLAGSAAVRAGGDTPVNIALHRPYEFSVAPNYSLCTGESDSTDLTDGILAPEREGSGFWGRQETVGWNHVRKAVYVTIDLGQVEPIQGAAVHTGAGVSGVSYPRSIAVMVSDDGQTFFSAGELVALTEDPLPPAYGTSSRYVYRTTSGLRSCGRYVRFGLVSSSVFLFADEIEVYRGDAAWLQDRKPGTMATDQQVVDPLRLTQLGVATRIRQDVEFLQGRIAGKDLSPERKQAWTTELHQLKQRLTSERFPRQLKGFQAISPVNSLHQQVFAVHGQTLEATGHDPLSVWQSPAWTTVDRFAIPSSDLPSLKVRLMQRERRSSTVNVTNATAQEMQVEVTLQGLPGGTNPKYVRLYRVADVDTREGNSLPCALLPVSGPHWKFTVPAGVTQPLWLSFEPEDQSAGVYTGQLILESNGDRKQLDVGLTVEPLKIDYELAADFYLWDYIIDQAYGVNEDNQRAAIQQFREDPLFNSVWCNPGDIPFPTAVDSSGNLTGNIDFTAWDRYVHTLPGARRYFAFAARQPDAPLAGLKMGSLAFDRAVSQWAAAWAKHNQQLGLKPGQVVLLFYDEPGHEPGYRTAYHYAKAFRAGTRDILLFTDPALRNLQEPWGQEHLQVSDIVCVHAPEFMTDVPRFSRITQALRTAGKELHFYNCGGPTRQFHPVHYRCQPWLAHSFGASGSGFWSYGDTGYADSFNVYPAIGRMNYAPLYLGSGQIASSTQWEAVREGMLDFVALKMLEQTLAESPGHPAADRARQFLASTKQRVIDPLVAAHGSYYSGAPLHADACRFAEQARLEALDLLLELQ